MYSTYINSKIIAERFNIATRTVSEWARQLGCTKREKSYSFNIHYFDSLDSEEKAYWLGFIFADGYLDIKNMLGIEIHVKDKEHLYKFKNCIGSTHPVHTYTKNSTYGIQTLSRIMLPFSKNINSLTKYGITRTKTYDGFPKNIPENNLNHFLRGLLDGDGCIHKTKYGRRFNWVSFCGNIQTMEFIMDCFQGKWSITRRFPDKDNNNCDISLTRKDECLKFLRWLYNDATIYLERKYNKLVI